MNVSRPICYCILLVFLATLVSSSKKDSGSAELMKKLKSGVKFVRRSLGGSTTCSTHDHKCKKDRSCHSNEYASRENVNRTTQSQVTDSDNENDEHTRKLSHTSSSTEQSSRENKKPTTGARFTISDLRDAKPVKKQSHSSTEVSSEEEN